MSATKQILLVLRGCIIHFCMYLFNIYILDVYIYQRKLLSY